jgi:hypothetical protein
VISGKIPSIWRIEQRNCGIRGIIPLMEEFPRHKWGAELHEKRENSLYIGTFDSFNRIWIQPMK